MLLVMRNAPWMLPMAMCGINTLSLAMGILYEGRLKIGALKFALAYASTIPAAVKHDLQPFFAILTIPPS